MATTGTATGVFDGEGAWAVTITGMATASGSSPIFTMKRYTETSFILEGVGAGATFTLYGSNDKGVTFVPVGQPVVLAGGTVANPVTQAGTLTPNQVPYGLYQWQWTGGGATTNIVAWMLGTIPR